MGMRPKRVASLLQEEVADILQKEFAGQIPAMVTVTGAEVSRDLSVARVYVSVYPPAQKGIAFKRLQELTPKIRAALAARLRHQMRSIPELRFALDESLERVARLEELFAQIKQQQGTSPEDASSDEEET